MNRLTYKVVDLVKVVGSPLDADSTGPVPWSSVILQA